MKTLIFKSLFIVSFLMQVSPVLADDSTIAIKNMVNPARSSGVEIGDVLKRTVTFDSSISPNVITKALPVKGTRNDEVELVESKLERLQEGSKNEYKLDLSYQVFTKSSKSRVMSLPAETINISSSEKLILPAWNFWFSPLVETSIVNAKANVQPQAKAPGIDLNQHRMRLSFFSGILLFAVVGLVYVNANAQWLPFLGGNFARAYKQIKQLSKSKIADANSQKKALFSLHQSFNKTYGSNLFADDIEDFILRHPRFNKFHQEIVSFFALSNRILFSQQPHDDSQLMPQLLAISKSLRDCERGV